MLLQASTLGTNCKQLEYRGSGGFGVVFRAHEINLDRKIAIKVLSSDKHVSDEIRSRFRREVRSLSKVNHPNVVRVFAFGQLEDGRPYYSMEYIEGQELSEIIKEQRGPMPLERATRIMQGALAGVSAVHKQGFIHRDLKPSNFILLSEHGQETVKLFDFGLVVQASQDGATQRLTSTGMICGTPLYMSPEQCRGEKLTPQSDIYALGCIFFEMLTGRPPFVATPGWILHLHQTEEPDLLYIARSDGLIYPNLENLIKTALAKRPEDRFASTDEFSAALQCAGEGFPITDSSLAKVHKKRTFSGATLPPISKRALASIKKEMIVIGLVIACIFAAAVVCTRFVRLRSQANAQSTSSFRSAASTLHEAERLRDEAKPTSDRRAIKDRDSNIERLTNSAIAQAQQSFDESTLAYGYRDLATMQMDHHQPAEAKSSILKAVEHARRAWSDHSDDRITFLTRAAQILTDVPLPKDHFLQAILILDEAEADAEKVGLRNPILMENVLREIYFERSSCYWMLKQHDRELSDLRKLVNCPAEQKVPLDSRLKDETSLASILLATGNSREALALLEHIIKTLDKLPPSREHQLMKFWFMRDEMIAYQLCDKTSEAEKICRDAIAFQSQYKVGRSYYPLLLRCELSVILFNGGRSKSAFSLLKQSLQQAESNEDLNFKAQDFRSDIAKIDGIEKMPKSERDNSRQLVQVAVNHIYANISDFWQGNALPDEDDRWWTIRKL